MKPMSQKLAGWTLLVMILGMFGCTGNAQRPSSDDMAKQKTAAETKTPSGTIVIDEFQIMWMVGGDIGGGTLEFQGQTHKFKMGGLKLGGFGAHKVKMTGDVWRLKDVGDFAGLYAEAEVGLTVGDDGKGDFWLENDKGVKLRLKSPESQGIALDLGVEGVDIRMK